MSDLPANSPIELVSHKSFPGFWSILGVAIILIAVAFSSAPGGTFVYDDEWQVVRNPLIQNPTLYKTALTSDVWSFRGGGSSNVSNYYRPVFTAWSILNFKFFGLEPGGWHIANILLHVLVTLLVLLFLIECGLSPPACAIGTWIFAVHPVHAESVTWIAGSPDLLMSGFLLGSALVWFRTRRRPSGWAWALSLILFFLALGSKETAIAFVPFIFGLGWILTPVDPERKAVATALKTAAPFLAVGVVFFLLRAMVMKGAGIGSQNPVGLTAVLLSVPEVFWFYIRQAFAPYEISSAYPLRTINPDALDFRTFWLPLAGLAAAIPAGIWLARRSATSAIGFWLFLLFLLPAFYIRAFHPEHIVRDRYLYLPILGLSMLALGALDFQIQGIARIAWGLGAVLAAGLSFLTWRTNAMWQSNVTLWTAGVQSDPKGAFAHMQLAEALRTSGNPAEAAIWAKKAIVLNPDAPRPHTVLGMIQKDTGDYGAAVQSFQKAISSGVDTQIASENLAEVYQKQNEPEKAIAVFDDEIGRNAGYKAIGVRNIAVLLVQQGRKDEALARLEGIRAELEAFSSPRSVAAWFFMAELYLEKNENAKAIEAYKAFLKHSEGASEPQLRNFRSLSEQMLRNLGERP